MSSLVAPHGGTLVTRLLKGEELEQEKRRAASLRQVPITSREASDLIMIGIGAFSPLTGFMGSEDWRAVCDECRMKDGLFWPIPITLSMAKDEATGIAVLPALNGYLLSGQTLPTVAPIIATALWCEWCTGVAFWRIRREEF